MQRLVADREQLLVLEQKVDATLAAAPCPCDVLRYLLDSRERNRVGTRTLCDTAMWNKPALYAAQLAATRQEHEALLTNQTDLCRWLKSQDQKPPGNDVVVHPSTT